jgi:hypothetical protein
MGHAHFEPFGSAGPDPDLRERSEFLHLEISNFNTRSNDLEVTTIIAGEKSGRWHSLRLESSDLSSSSNTVP